MQEEIYVLHQESSSTFYACEFFNSHMAAI